MEKKNKGLSDFADLDAFGSQGLFKHIVEINDDKKRIYLSHASNWAKRTNYFGSLIKLNDGIDHSGLLL